jgi:hypothetical protein
MLGFGEGCLGSFEQVSCCEEITTDDLNADTRYEHAEQSHEQPDDLTRSGFEGMEDLY